MLRIRRFLHTAVVFSMLMTLVAVAFPAAVGAANLSINPQSWDFGAVEVGTTSISQEFTITNTGNVAYNINDISTGTNGQWFDVTANGCLDAVLLVGQSCVFSVVFEPSILGDVQGTIDIDVGFGDPDSEVTVSGSGVNPTLGMNPAPPFNFGSEQIGDTSAQQVITFTNNGAEDIQFLDIQLFNQADFNIETGGSSGNVCELNLPLGPGDSCSIRVTFTPDNGVPGPRSGGLGLFFTTEGGFRTLSYALNGNAVVGTLSATPNPVDFGSVLAGPATAPITVTLTNTGVGPLRLNGTAINGANQGLFETIVGSDNCTNTTLAANGQPGDSCTVQVRFNAGAGTNPGQKAAVLRFDVQSGANGPYPAQKFDVPLQAVVVSGVLSVSPTSHDFGPQVIGTYSAPTTFTVTNNSAGQITITDLVESGQAGQFDLLDGTCEGATLQSGQTCTFQVAFKPVGQPGQKNASVFIEHSGSNDDVEVNLTGYAVDIPLTISPSGTFDFGDVVIGETAYAAFTVTNPSPTGHTFASITVTPDPPFALAAENCAPTLGSGQTCTLIVSFTPNATGPANGILEVNPIVLLVGNGVAPDGALVTSTPQLTFGAQQIDTQSTTQAVIVSNNGNVAVALGTPAVDLTGDDYIIQGGLGTNCQDGVVLDPGESCIVWVAFEPNGPPGDSTEYLTINYTSAAVADGDLVIALRGIATTPHGSVSPLQLDFGAQEILTTSGPQTVTFTNTGTGTIVIPVVTLAGPHAAEFLIQTDACSGTTVLAGEDCDVSVVFRPTSSGAKNAQLAVGALPNSDIVTLKGVGVDPLLIMSPAGPVDFGSVIADGAGGQYSLRTFTFTNTGSNDVVVPAPIFTGPFGLEATDCFLLNPLGPGASCQMVVRFDPSTVGMQNGTIVVNPVAQLYGMGVAPSGALSVSPPQLTFGPQQIGTQSGTQQIIVSNNGNIPVTVNTVSVVGGDYILANGAGNTCQPGVILGASESCSLWVAFLPGGPPGPKNSQVDITYTSGAVPAGTVSVLLRGNAISPNGTVSPLQLDFGFQEVGVMSAPQTVTFTNIGTEIIVIPPVAVAPAGQFIIQSDSCSGASVLPGQTCQLSVVFLPTIAGSHEAALTVGALPNPWVVTLKGVGVDATISVTPLDYDFGYVVVGQTAIKAFTVTNNGSDPVAIPPAMIAPPGGEFTVLSEDCTFLNPLGPGASCTIVVQYAPTNIGPDNATMMVNPIVTLHGTGVAPSGALSASPVQLTFGNVQVGAMSATQTITFSNNGTIPVLLETLPLLAGPNAADFLLTVAGNTCQVGVALNPGESCVVSVAFRPTNPGNREAWVNLEYSSASVPNGFVSVLLRGVGVTPVVTVSPNQLVYGPQSQNTASQAKTVVVTNMSNGPVTLGGLALGGTNPGDFQLVADLCTNATLAAGATCTFSVVFLPTSGTGPKNATVIVPVLGLSNVIVNLTGQALAAQQGGVSFSPAFHDFGYVQVGSPTAPRPVTLTNNGNAVLNVGDIDIVGPGFLDFFPLIADNCEQKSLNPGESCTVWIRFRPVDTGLSEVGLIFNTDLPGSPHAVYLYGVGITPILSISPVQLNFGNLQVGSVSAPYTVTVTNNSTGHVNLDLDGPYTGDFELVGQLCDDATLAPGGSCTFSITFRPQSTGTQTDAVDIDITPGGLDFEVDLVGVGLTPNGMVSPLQLDFGAVQVGFTSGVQTVRYTNTGSGPISVPPVNLAGPNASEFLIQTDSCSNATVPSGGWCEVSVVFRPQTQGPKNAQLSIAPLHNPDVVTLKGFGSVPSPAFDAAAVDFGTQPLMVESTPRRVTVTNNGGGVLLLFGQITNASIMGPDAADFSVKVSTCNDVQLDPGESCYVDITFKPQPPLGPDPDIRTAWLEFVTNMPTAVQTVPLTGQVGQFNVNVVVGLNPCVAIDLSLMGPYAGDDEVTATATVAATDVFIGWILDGYYVGFANPLDFKIKDSSHQLEAVCVAKPTFSDIGASQYQDEIEHMAAHGFIKGYFGLSGPYGPNDGVLRSQMAVIISRMANRTNGWNTETPANPFTDQCNIDGCVDPESWNAVGVGFQKQVIRGVGFGLFAPFSPVTEIQVVAFTSRTLIAMTHELEERGRYPACPNPSIPAPPIASVSPCSTPPNFLTGEEGVYPATKWEQQLDNVTVYGNVPQASGHRVDISTYYYYVGSVPGPNGSTIGPATNWPTWTSAAEREQVAAIMWWAFADYWGTDRIDELP
jgi:hypothetical protein